MKKDVSDKQEDDKDEKSDKQEEIIIDKEKPVKEKALFVQRAVAFIIDSLFVFLIASLISFPFINDKNVEKINTQINELNEKMINNDIESEEYLYKYMDVTYDLARNNGFSTIINITVCILYFVVFQIYNNGQTIGKKLMKIRIISNNGDLTMNQMIFRSLICNTVLVDFLSVFFLILGKKDVYFYCIGLFSLLYYIVFITSVFMVMFGKEGTALHDKIVHTRVVRTN